jgi:hypothetical protein
LALSVGAAALAAAALSATEPRAQTAPAPPASASNPMAAARGARSLLRNGVDYLDYGEPERALELLREAETRQFELNPDERTQLNRAIVRARQAIRAGDAPGTTAPVTVRTARSRRAGSIVLNTPPPMPALPPAPAAEPPPPAEPIQLTSGTQVEEPAPLPAPMPAATVPQLTPVAEAPAPAGRLADEAPPPLLEATPETFPDAAEVPASIPEPAPVAPSEPEAAAPPVVAEAAAPEPQPVPAAVAVPAELPPLPEQVSAPPAPPIGSEEAPDASPIAEGPPTLAVESSDPLASGLEMPAAAPMPSAEPVAETPSAEPVAEVPVVPEVPEVPVMPEAPIPASPGALSEAAAAALPTPVPLSELEASPAATMETTDAPVSVEPTAAPGPIEAVEEPPLPPPAEEIVAPAAPREDRPTSAPGLPPLPEGSGSGSDRSATARLDERTAPARGESLLSPETRREVEELARRQRIDMRGGSQSEPTGLQRPGIGLPGGLSGAGETRPSSLPPLPRDAMGNYELNLGGGYGASQPSESRIELPRPPSPTEPRPIRSIPVPEEFVAHTGRNWAPSRKVWAAAATCHGPLYFQDAVLERYGQSAEQAVGPAGRFLTYPLDDPNESNLRMQIIQPFYSIGKFSAQVATWPVRLVLDPPWEAEYDLGYYRPGDRIPPDTWYFPEHGVGPPLRGRNY